MSQSSLLFYVKQFNCTVDLTVRKGLWMRLKESVLMPALYHLMILDKVRRGNEGREEKEWGGGVGERIEVNGD